MTFMLIRGRVHTGRYAASSEEAVVFERYTEKARRAIFFARYEVSEYGASAIGAEHLLLGLLREDPALLSRFLPGDVSVEGLREQVAARIHRGEKISTSVEVPLSNELKGVLQGAAEQSEGLSHRHIGTEHLLLGLLGARGSPAARVLGRMACITPRCVRS